MSFKKLYLVPESALTRDKTTQILGELEKKAEGLLTQPDLTVDERVALYNQTRQTLAGVDGGSAAVPPAHVPVLGPPQPQIPAPPPTPPPPPPQGEGPPAPKKRKVAVRKSKATFESKFLKSLPSPGEKRVPKQKWSES